MPPARDPEALAALREALEGLAAGARELERLCLRAAGFLESLSTGDGAEPAEPSAESEPAPARELPPAQAALLVGVTARGGTVDGATLEGLAARLGLAGALEALFDGPAPHLTRRGGGSAGVTERGVEEAARWRNALPVELLRAATDA